jgi:hypothetical protein
MSDMPAKTPQEILADLEQKIQALNREYSEGVINSAQFNAIYRYFSEKRTLIEHILETNPDNPTWRAVAETQNTDYLRAQFEARALYYAVFRRGHQQPLLADGKIPRKAAEQVIKLLNGLWEMPTLRKGVARKSLGEGLWTLLCIGDQAMTIAVYFLQPSNLQLNRLKDIHDDFERANSQLLKRSLSAERMIFPQRALIDKS